VRQMRLELRRGGGWIRTDQHPRAVGALHPTAGARSREHWDTLNLRGMEGMLVCTHRRSGQHPPATRQGATT
jgi:hypothetical protein